MNFFFKYIYLWLITIFGTALGTILAMLFLYEILKIPQKFEEQKNLQKEILKSTKELGIIVATNIKNKIISFYFLSDSTVFEHKILHEFSIYLKNKNIENYIYDLAIELNQKKCREISNQDIQPVIQIQYEPNPDEIIIGYNEEGLIKSFDEIYYSFKLYTITQFSKNLNKKQKTFFHYNTAHLYDRDSVVLYIFIQFLKNNYNIEFNTINLKDSDLENYKNTANPQLHPRLLIHSNNNMEFETIYFLDEIDKVQNYFGLLFLEFQKAQPGWFKKTTKE